MIEVITTDDGSSSLYVEELDETYHSRNGAMAEAMHVYINAGFNFLAERGVRDINIFEMGLGTGLNVILTFARWQKYSGITVNYTSVEKYPLGENITRKLVYAGITDNDALTQVYEYLHASPWDTEVPLAKGFTFTKINTDIHRYNFAGATHNCVYYDAFAPSKQNDVWQPEVLGKVARALSAGGVVVTYCAKGEYKRTMQALGLRVEVLPGPAGKKEMTRSIKTNL